MRGRGDALQELLAKLPDSSLENQAHWIAAGHRAMAKAAAESGDERTARFHQALEEDVFKRLRESAGS